MKYIANFPCSSASADSLISTSRQSLCRVQGLQHRGEVCLVPDSGEHPSWWAGGNRWGFRSSETVSARYWGRQDCVERVSSGSRYLSPNSRNRPPLLSMLIQLGKDLLCFPRRNLLSFLIWEEGGCLVTEHQAGAGWPFGNTEWPIWCTWAGPSKTRNELHLFLSWCFLKRPANGSVGKDPCHQV